MQPCSSFCGQCGPASQVSASASSRLDPPVPGAGRAAVDAAPQARGRVHALVRGQPHPVAVAGR